ncbi:hypothetical protein FACS1894121_1730 [Bacteroidia bacterium]|nr:hypothetical protein FACS1894121_1730 [Bacteroidia bacterium]
MNKTASTQPTFESIMAILDRTAERQEAFEKLHAAYVAEADKRREEYEKRRKREAAEADKRSEKEAAEYKEYVKQQEKKAAEADRRAAEADKRREKEAADWHARWKKIEEAQANVSKEIGGIASNNGYFAEEYFINALQKKKTFAGIRYDHVEPNIKSYDNKLQDEFDIVMYNGSSIAIIEVKYRVHPDFLTTLSTKKVENFRKLFPNYAKHKIYLGIASMSFNAEVIVGAKKLGIGMLKPQGDTLECDTEHIKAY